MEDCRLVGVPLGCDPSGERVKLVAGGLESFVKALDLVGGRRRIDPPANRKRRRVDPNPWPADDPRRCRETLQPPHSRTSG
jgi:hypothetical protein